MPKRSKKEKYRVTLDFSSDSQEYMDELQKLTGCATRAELFKQALNVLDYVSNEVSKGARFVIERDDEKREVVFPFMARR